MFCAQALLGFVNFKLYHTLELSYPPTLDRCAESGLASAPACFSQICVPGSVLDDGAAGMLAVRAVPREVDSDGARADDAAELDAALQ